MLVFDICGTEHLGRLEESCNWSRKMSRRSSTSINLPVAMLQGPRDGSRGPIGKTSSAVAPSDDFKTVGCFLLKNLGHGVETKLPNIFVLV